MQEDTSPRVEEAAEERSIWPGVKETVVAGLILAGILGAVSWLSSRTPKIPQKAFTLYLTSVRAVLATDQHDKQKAWQRDRTPKDELVVKVDERRIEPWKIPGVDKLQVKDHVTRKGDLNILQGKLYSLDMKLAEKPYGESVLVELYDVDENHDLIGAFKVGFNESAPPILSSVSFVDDYTIPEGDSGSLRSRPLKVVLTGDGRCEYEVGLEVRLDE